MGRPRTKNPDLPPGIFIQCGSYYYVCGVDGKAVWQLIGKDRAFAIELAERLNRLKRAERLKKFGAWRQAIETTRSAVFDRDAHRCVYCGSTNDLGIDHIIPYSAGGSTKPFNLVTCCSECNSAKGNSDPREFILQMLGMRDLVAQIVTESI